MLKGLARVGVATAAAVAVPASAQIVDVSGQYGTNGATTRIYSPGTYTGYSPSGSQTVIINTSPIASVQTRTSAGQGDGIAEGSFTYGYEVLGAPNAMVPVSIDFSEGTTASGHAGLSYALLSTTLYGSDGVQLPYPDAYILVCSAAGDDSCDYGGWSGLASIIGGQLFGYVPSDTQINVGLQTASFVDGTAAIGGEGSSSSAFVDPKITVLDPNFTLQLSGVGNETGLFGAVPEPATWAMMLLGFGAIGLALRGRKALPQAPQVA